MRDPHKATSRPHTQKNPFPLPTTAAAAMLSSSFLAVNVVGPTYPVVGSYLVVITSYNCNCA